MAEPEKKKIRLRNYKPTDERIEVVKASPVVPPSILLEEQLSKEVKQAEELIDSNEVVVAPKKPDWDLKRNIAKGLRTLEMNTRKAIREIIEERKAAEAQEDDDAEEG